METMREWEAIVTLTELKDYVDNAIKYAKECGQDPSTIIVSIQVDDTESESLWSDDIELTYDNDGNASGCVLHGWTKKHSANG